MSEWKPKALVLTSARKPDESLEVARPLYQKVMLLSARGPNYPRSATLDSFIALTPDEALLLRDWIDEFLHEVSPSLVPPPKL